MLAASNRPAHVSSYPALTVKKEKEERSMYVVCMYDHRPPIFRHSFNFRIASQLKYCTMISTGHVGQRR